MILQIHDGLSYIMKKIPQSMWIDVQIWLNGID